MDVTFIVDFVITLAVTVVTAYAVPYLAKKYGAEKLATAYEVVKILVNAVEQTTKATGVGAMKKQVVKERLEAYNLKIDGAKIDELIESAVHEMNVATAAAKEEK